MPIPQQFVPRSIRLLLALALAAGATAQTTPRDGNWPSFRGHLARGIAEGHPTPVEWDVETGTNIRWKTPIPGLSHSSPVIWGDRIFVTTAVRLEGESELKVGIYGSPTPAGEEGVHRFQVYCLDKHSGQTIWVRTAIEAVPKYQRHPKGSHAASSPVTDGKRVVACFASEGLYTYDMDGALLWSRDLGDLDSGWYVARGAQFGFASSPVIHENMVILQVDVQENSSLWAMDAEDGSDIWRTPRHDVPTWSTPTIDVEGGRNQVVVNGYKHMGGYDLATGEELWKLSGGGDVPVPAPIVHSGMIFITNGHGRWNPVYAIDANVRGEIADGFTADGESILWSQRSRGAYMQTPILYRDRLYVCNDSGVVACIDPTTGEQLNRERLGGGSSGFTASPVAADGKLYYTSEEGAIHVLEADQDMELLAVNEMGETCMATPAISEGVLYFRTRGHLVAVAGNDPLAPQLADSQEQADALAAEAEVTAVAAEETPIPAGLPAAATLFARHLEARGGREALERPATIEVTGKFAMPSIGLEGAVVSRYGRDLRFSASSDMGAMGITRQGYDGTVGWIISPQVGTQMLEGAMLQQMKTEADWLADAEYERRYTAMLTVAREEFHGFDCFVARVTNSAGQESKIYFERETGLVRGRDGITTTAGGPMQIISVIRTYRDFGGLLIPTETEVIFPAHNMSQIMTVQRVEYDTLEETVFALPPEIVEKIGQ